MPICRPLLVLDPTPVDYSCDLRLNRPTVWSRAGRLVIPEPSVFWKIALVVVLPLLLYGRSSLFRHPLLRLLSPRPRPSTNRPEPPKAVVWSESRLLLGLIVLAAVAVGSLVATRLLIGRS